MNLASIRIITEDAKKLMSFYEEITGAQATFYTDEFGELKTETTTLAIGSTKTLALFGGQSIAETSSNRSVIIEFKVADVDKEYERIKELIKESVVQLPTTMPWGNRSLLFRDTDGNLVNFFTTPSV